MDNLDAVKEEPDLPDAQREIGRSLGGSGEGSNDPSGSQQPVPSPESGPNNEDESTDIDSFVGSPRSGNYQEGHREGDMDRDHQHRQLRPKGCFNTVAGSKSLKRKSAAAINTKLPEGVQTNAPEPWKRKHGILSRPSNAAAQTTFDKRAALASRQATSELRELPASKPVSKLTKAGTAIEGTALEKLCQSRVYLSKFRQHYDLAHQHFVRQVNEIIQMTSVLERQEHQAAKSSGRQGRRSQIDMAPISRACTAAMGIMNSYAAPTAPPPSWLPQNYLTGPCTHHFMYPTLVPLPHLGNFGPRYTAMHPANAAFFRGGQAPFQGFHVNEVAPSKRPVPDAALKRQMRNGNSQFSSQQLVQMVPVDGEGQCGVAFPVSNLVG